MWKTPAIKCLLGPPKKTKASPVCMLLSVSHCIGPYACACVWVCMKESRGSHVISRLPMCLPSHEASGATHKNLFPLQQNKKKTGTPVKATFFIALSY